MDSVPAHDTQAIAAQIITRAREFGADLAGLAAVSELKLSPSALFSEHLAAADDPPLADFSSARLPFDLVSWPEEAKTVLVIGVHHPVNRPEMDWWIGSADPPGNRTLAKIIKNLCSWISEHFQTDVFHLPYDIDKGGIHLKDAAVLSGLGCIGKNNMLVTPEFGPRIRLRALTLAVDLPTTGKQEFDPCTGCQQWCRKACPQMALSMKISCASVSQDSLPGRDGNYSRQLCDIQMVIDEEQAREHTFKDFEDPVKLIKYCRFCELSCPVGRLRS
ncbi:MAG: epoxyqueuosine reductase [Desulfofustis sp.]|nr:epoxyqueuosine reductase [Desulfofustis sp.]